MLRQLNLVWRRAVLLRSYFPLVLPVRLANAKVLAEAPRWFISAASKQPLAFFARICGSTCLYLPRRWTNRCSFVVVFVVVVSFAKFYDPRAKLEQQFFIATKKSGRRGLLRINLTRSLIRYMIFFVSATCQLAVRFCRDQTAIYQRLSVDSDRCATV